ncbi:MAG: glycosyl hydrolase [Candidatus Aminicenantes bacterium]|nr:glycosyl hydrolase [Candidatus Aminicenantes bacterium]
MKKLFFLSLVLFLILPVLTLGESKNEKPVKIDEYIFGSIKARAIGPAVMSGRISCLDAVNENPNIIYVGAAGGGIWKSINGGASFKPVFDKYNQCIGSICIDQCNPKTVWVGTGECWTRNSVSVGDGIYKTTDSGDNWKNLGLKETERISRIVINPQNPDIVYVAAMGHLWNANEERGVYKTTDGGKTWEKILYVDKNTGCADLAINPKAPNIIYAAMWQYRRYPYFFNSGGPGSGLYRSLDGGRNWKKIHKGLPRENLGRISIAISPVRPGTIFCIVESKKTALYRSTDMGENWKKMSAAPIINERPFYFNLLIADPQDHQILYKPSFVLGISKDGGETFESTGGPHVDFHALWINPSNPKHMILGTDGGVYVSYSRGYGWRFLNNLPVSQFYRISYDMDDPYYVYGGLQDNGSWTGPSRSPGGIKNSDWVGVGWGDGFYVFVDPKDKNIVYSEYQGGNIFRTHRDTRESKDIKPYPTAGEPEFRFNWNTPIHVTKEAIYVGSQFLFHSTNRGDSWQKISPDLTTNDPQKQQQEKTGGLTIDNTTAENHCTIYAISVSPKNSDIIWAGTDDGNLQVTRNGGEIWNNVVSNITGLPRHTWCSGVQASRHDPNTAFVVFDGHRMGDMNTYVFKTTDLGKNWTSLSSDSIKGYARVIRDDLVNPDLLFLGTESGLFISIDGGKQWAQFTGNFPHVAVHDLAIHPREDDLIIGTHGRGIYIIDDITLLRKISQPILQKKVHLFEPSPVYIKTYGGDYRKVQSGEWTGTNPLLVGKISYYLKRRHMFGNMKLEIFDSEGKLLKTLPGGKRRGMNIVYWFLRYKPPKVPPARRLAGYALRGPLTPEGTYKIKLTKGKETYTTELKVQFSDEYPHSAKDRKVQQETVWKLYHMQEDLAYTGYCVTQVRDQAKERAAQLKRAGSLQKKLKQLVQKLDAMYKKLAATRKDQGITGEEQLREKVVELYGVVNNYGGLPTESQLKRMQVLEKEVKKASTQFKSIAKQELNAINQKLKTQKIKPITIPTLEEYKDKNK